MEISITGLLLTLLVIAKIVAFAVSLYWTSITIMAQSIQISRFHAEVCLGKREKQNEDDDPDTLITGVNNIRNMRRMVAYWTVFYLLTLIAL